MELNPTIINQLHQIEPSIWESLHDEQDGIQEDAAMYEEHKDRDRFRFAKRLNSRKFPVIVYNVKSGCFSTLLRIDSLYNVDFSQFWAVASGYSPRWEIDDCLFFYEQDGYKVVEGIDGFIRKKCIYSSAHENSNWVIPEVIERELSMVSLNASWLSIDVAKTIGGRSMSVRECRSHEEEIKRMCEHFARAKEMFYTNLRSANVEVF